MCGGLTFSLLNLGFGLMAMAQPALPVKEGQSKMWVFGRWRAA